MLTTQTYLLPNIPSRYCTGIQQWLRLVDSKQANC